MLVAVLLMAQLAAEPSIAERVENLERQIDVLNEIEVPSDLRAAKSEEIEKLNSELHAQDITSASLNLVYDHKQAVRIWLFDNASEQPSLAPGEFVDDADTWSVSTPDLTVVLDKTSLAMTVKTAAETWEFARSNNTDVVLHDESTFSLASARSRTAEPLRTGYSMGMSIQLSSFPKYPELSLGINIDLVGTEMSVMLVGVKDSHNLTRIEWPKAIQFGNSPEDFSVIPNMQGILVPGNWPQEIAHDDLVYTRTLSMPWWGQINAQGHGVLTFYESADDAGVDYHHPAGGPTRLQPRWYSSLGSVRYPRVVRYVFDDDATYVKQAKRFRRYLQETGQFVTLAQKALEVPNVNNIIGRPYIWLNSLNVNVKGSRFYRDENRERNWRMTSFSEICDELRNLKKAGIDDVYLHLGGYNTRGYDSRHPDHLPPSPEAGGWDGMRQVRETCDELGYFFVLHDQYRDYYLDSASFDERMTITKWDGSRDEHAEWAGGRQTYLSSWFQPGYVRRNHDLLAAHNMGVQGAFIDVFSVVPLEESFQPMHPLTRTDCARLRKECFALLRARGYIVSSEEPTAYLAPALHLTLRGGYPAGPKGYGAGEGIGIPVPLFNLVFHDSMIHPWHVTEDGGWGVPKGDAGWLHCMLNAGMPEFNLRMVIDDGLVDRIQKTSDLMKRLAFEEMVNHEFLDKDRRVQRTTWSNGMTVTVDFEKGTCAVD